MPGQHADHVPALPSAQADQLYVPGGGMTELSVQVPLHAFSSPREQRTGIVAAGAVAYSMAGEVIGGPAEAPESGTPA
jgi:hypothetical protein